MKKPIIIIAGPTASGKTSLAISLAKKFNGEIINADSRSIYREMDIATSKPSKQERHIIPHHLIDIVEPDESFTLSDFKQRANVAILQIQNREKIPFLVGGTGLYLNSIAYNYNLAKTEPNLTLRNELDELPIAELTMKLKSLDPITYKKIDLGNKRRLIRAIEVSSQTKTSFSDLQTKNPKPSNFLYLVLDMPREVLYDRINQRVDNWKDQGLVEETEKLMARYSTTLPSMSTIGYKEIIDYLNGTIEYTEAIDIMKKRTRNYAKRQITWFKKNKDAILIKNDLEAIKQISFLVSPETNLQKTHNQAKFNNR